MQPDIFLPVTLELNQDLAEFFAAALYSYSLAEGIDPSVNANIALTNVSRLQCLLSKERREEFEKYKNQLREIPIDQLARVGQDAAKVVKPTFDAVREKRK